MITGKVALCFSFAFSSCVQFNMNMSDSIYIVYLFDEIILVVEVDEWKKM